MNNITGRHFLRPSLASLQKRFEDSGIRVIEIFSLHFTRIESLNLFDIRTTIMQMNQKKRHLNKCLK